MAVDYAHIAIRCDHVRLAMEQFGFPRSFVMTIVCTVWRVGWEGWRSVVNVLNVSAVGAKIMVS